MAAVYPHSQFMCTNARCPVTVYGRMNQLRETECCPRCETYNITPVSKELWVASMIVSEWLKGSPEYPQA